MTTRYSEIAQYLRDKISDDTYPPGSTIPAIPDLMSQWDVARDTVRDAVSRLTHEGLVIPRRGVGTIVRDSTPVDLGYTPSSPAQVWSAQAGEAVSSDTLVSVQWLDPEPGVIQRLELPPNTQVLYRARHQYKGKAIAQLMDQWLPGPTVSGALQATGIDIADNQTPLPTDLFSVLGRAGDEPTTVTETLRARMPHPDETDLMELPPGVPVLVTYRVTRNQASIPIEAATFVGAGDRMSQSFTVPLSKK